MVDDINIIAPEIKSFDENISNDDSFLNSEPYEEEIFCDVRRKDRICAKCGEDHTFKLNFVDVRTSIEHIPVLFSLNKNTTEISTDKKNYDIGYTQAVACRLCSTPVIYEITTIIYNLDPYVEDQKLEHRHPTDPDTLCDVLERVSTEVRLLDTPDPNDCKYYVEG